MRKVVITGGSKGIGYGIAEAFINNGDAVCISSRANKNLVEAKNKILAKYPNANINTFVCDMSKREDVEDFATFVLKDFNCDILINNAGVFIPGSIKDEPEGNLDLMWDTNLKGTYQLTRLLLPQMIENNKGDIVNICSIASKIAYANGGSYSISKFAMLGFSKNLREEMKPHGVRVMSILPGAVYTDSWSSYDGPIERLMPVEDIASIVLNACNLSRRTVVEEIIIRPQLGDL